MYLSETKLFHFHEIFKNWGNETPERPLDPPLLIMNMEKKLKFKLLGLEFTEWLSE